MKNLIEHLPALIVIAAILVVIAASVFNADKVDLDENKIESK